MNNVMDYIKQKHSDAAPFIKEGIRWTKADTVVRVGYTRSVYRGDGWSVTVGRGAIAETMYEARAEYDNIIVWIGTIKDGHITEDSYSRK